MQEGAYSEDSSGEVHMAWFPLAAGEQVELKGSHLWAEVVVNIEEIGMAAGIAEVEPGVPEAVE